MNSTVMLGIYEKALVSTPDWDEFFAQVAKAGFAFVDLSIDESPTRAARLDWDWQTCEKIRAAAHRQGVFIGALCLSLHRAVMPGSADPHLRARALQVYLQAIDLAARLGVSTIQVAGYYAYYEDADERAKLRYQECLEKALAYASMRGVILAVENVDGNDICGIDDAAALIAQFQSPWLQIYPDLGNVAEHGGDAVRELRAGSGHTVAIHIKDVRRGEPRRVPLGEGITDFAASFKEICRQGWHGRMMIEMWNDEDPESIDICIRAREKVAAWLQAHGITPVDCAGAREQLLGDGS